MYPDKSELIKKLCASWIQKAQSQNGGLTIGAHTEKFRLRKNGIVFPELNFAEIRTACKGLSSVLIHKGLNTIVDTDHHLLWAWLAELILQDRTFFSSDEHEIRELFQSTFRIALSSSALNQTNIKKITEIDTRILFIISDSTLILTYLGFPLLEALLKKQCRSFIAYNGKVIKEFEVPKKNSPDELRKYSIGKQCSNIRDLLYLLNEKVADPELKEDLLQFRKQIAALVGDKDGFDIIGEWRNSSLHGETSLNTISGAILNFAVLLSLHSIKQQYNDLRLLAIRRIKFNSQDDISHRAPWSFYPPF